LKWYGSNVENEINFEGVSIRIGPNRIVILLNNRENPNHLFNFYISIIYFNKLVKIDSIFGIFVDYFSDLKKKRLKESFLQNISHSNLIYLLEGGNIEAYYENNVKTSEFQGIEFRSEKNFNEILDKNKILIELIGEIGKQRKKFFNDK
jgi:hypothetical protein